ncbi:hypothetical protein ON010_g8669 [Phytophthora cinnamomi]|nr:hypothetical protein ON010_g8669 [Phytophthora cinnamomi]
MQATTEQRSTRTRNRVTRWWSAITSAGSFVGLFPKTSPQQRRHLARRALAVRICGRVGHAFQVARAALRKVVSGRVGQHNLVHGVGLSVHAVRVEDVDEIRGRDGDAEGAVGLSRVVVLVAAPDVRVQHESIAALVRAGPVVALRIVPQVLSVAEGLLVCVVLARREGHARVPGLVVLRLAPAVLAARQAAALAVHRPEEVSRLLLLTTQQRQVRVSAGQDGRGGRGGHAAGRAVVGLGGVRRHGARGGRGRALGL